MLRKYESMTAHFENFEDDAPRLTDAQISEILEQAEQKIATRAQWCKGMACADADGKELIPYHDDSENLATCFCLGEAIFRVVCDWRRASNYRVKHLNLDADICEVVSDAIIDLFGFRHAADVLNMHVYFDPDHDRDEGLRYNMHKFNDHLSTSHEDVIKLLRHARAAL